MKRKWLTVFPDLLSWGLKRRLDRTNPKRELPGLRPEKRLDSLKSKRRLTSQFEGIENVKNFDVEKWYNFNFLFAESFK
jgi:hypothetical protein